MTHPFIYRNCLTSFCVFALLGIVPAYADGPATGMESARLDVPLLGPAAILPSRTLVPLTEDSDLSLMTLIFGAQTGLEYNSNIYRASTSEQSDLIATLSPRIALKSNLAKHRLDMSVTPEIGRYLSESKNNYVDWDARMRGRYDVSLTNALSLDARYRKGHVAIGSFEDEPTATLQEPVTYDQFDLGAQWEGQQNLLHYAAGTSWHSYDYENVLREDTTTSIQDDRDRDVIELTGKLGYEFISSFVTYVRGSFNSRSYDTRVDSSAVYTRDSDGYGVALGLSRDIPESPFRFDAYVGYLAQNYDATQLDDVSAPDAHFDGSWQITPADLFTLSLDREVKDTNTDGVSSTLQSNLAAELVHDFTEQFALGAHTAYTNSNYQTNLSVATLDREDHIYEAGLGARYSLWQNVDLRMDYTYRDRESNQALTDYAAHIAGISLSIDY